MRWRDLVVASLQRGAEDSAGEGWKDVGAGPGSAEGDFIDWLTFPDETSSLVVDVARVRNHPLVPSYIQIHGYVYDVKSGKLIEVPEATRIGAAS
ncbi:hypothetical protein DB345_20835 [Spartobacteria bacterium LR76]|nr:hypothetical protein DB345_20835 [Spartobacteria bacterium LR76]